MKKLIILILVLLMTATASGCGKDKSNNDLPTEVSDPAATDGNTHDTPIDAPQSTQSADYPTNSGYLPGASALISDFTVLSQYPELPTGCEVTSLTMVLNYNGLPADKCDISDNHLEKGEVGAVDFRVAFEGDPRDENSFGCYSPVLVKAANHYLTACGSQLRARDISGSPLTDLFPYIDSGVPVIVWGTQDCAQGHYSVTWNVDGQDLTWYTPEHCMVLLGYSDYQVWVADPMHGEVIAYDRELFDTRYQELFQQAIVIQ